MAILKDGELYSELEGNHTVVYAVTSIPLLSLQCCRDFQIRKLLYSRHEMAVGLDKRGRELHATI